MATKYHIKKNGEKAVCHATKRACPRGGASQHFTSIEDCNVAIDKINEKTANNEYAIARVGNKIVISDESKESIKNLTTAQINIEKIEKTVKAVKDSIRDVFEEVGAKKASTEYGDLTFVAASERRQIDVDKMKESGIYEDYLRDSEKSSYVTFKILDDEDGAKRAKLTEPDKLNYSFTKDDVLVDLNGVAHLSENGLNLVKKLKYMDQSLKVIKEKHKEQRDKFKEAMQEEDLPGIKFGGSYWESVPETTARIVDSKALKESGLYDDYCKTTETSSSLRVKWAD